LRPAGVPPAAHQVPTKRRFETLPPNDFLRDLHREKRRAERSGAPLSLVVYRIEPKAMRDPVSMDCLLETLHRRKRETDTIGHVGDDQLVVLCPDTDERGTAAFMRKVEQAAAGLPLTARSATYPDDLFESLDKGTATSASFQPFLVSEEQTEHPPTYPLKRALDVCGAAIGLLLLWPVMLAAVAAIALTSAGPVIFRQTRIGKGGAPFTFYKFRSMVVENDDGAHRAFVAGLISGAPVEAVDGADKARYKMRADPRITPVGRFLRKTSIDELPQLFNVLKGDMSLVGPRPPIPYEATQYQAWHLRRLTAVKPGITGLWQVEGRSRVGFSEMVRMDLRYIRECSLALDLRLLCRTVRVVVRCDGAA
jgi:lipopolysaccharide/colanic/teichoic acid biosynthesis glycosyltransferase